MIVIKETIAFGQVVTAVLNDQKILDIRKGPTSDHAKSCARYHAEKEQQGMIQIHEVHSRIHHMVTGESNDAS